jgi:hypothetical protein
MATECPFEKAIVISALIPKEPYVFERSRLSCHREGSADVHLVQLILCLVFELMNYLVNLYFPTYTAVIELGLRSTYKRHLRLLDETTKRHQIH